jgi:hypothetical protein
MIRTVSFPALPRVSILLLLSLALASCAERSQMPAKSFEGTITEVIQVPGIADMMSARSDSDGERPQGMAALGALSNMTLKMFVRDNKVAYDVSILGGLITMRSIVDRDARTLTVLMPNHMAMVTDLRGVDSMRGKIDDSIRAHTGMFDSLAQMLPQPTGQKETLNGLDAEEYHASRDGTDLDLWLSSNDKIKAFEIVRDAFLGRGNPGAGGLDEIFAVMRPVAGKIPAKFEVKREGKTFAKGEMTDITEEKLDDAVFDIPKDYTVVNSDSANSAFRIGMGTSRSRDSAQTKSDSAQTKSDSAKPRRRYTAP